MKVLLRKWNDEEYTWKDAEYKNGAFYIGTSPTIESNIVSVIDDNRDNLVRCSACGEYFEKDSPDIEVHKNRYKNVQTCIGCPNLYTRAIDCNNTRFERIENGEYRKIEERVYEMYCSMGWRSYKVGTADAQNRCTHHRCATADMVPIKDIFTDYPGAFDDIVTIDKVLSVGYREKVANGYRLNGRNNIAAFINTMGIVDHFILTYHNDDFRLVYSKKYDKLFYVGGGRYQELDTFCLPQRTIDYVKNRIAELYN